MQICKKIVIFAPKIVVYYTKLTKISKGMIDRYDNIIQQHTGQSTPCPAQGRNKKLLDVLSSSFFVVLRGIEPRFTA